MQIIVVIPTTKEAKETTDMTTTGESRRVWTAQDNKRQMQVSDDAYNARDIAHFNHHDNARTFYPTYEIDMPTHIAEIVGYYAAFPDMEGRETGKSGLKGGGF